MKIVKRTGPKGANRYSVRTNWRAKYLRKDWDQKIIQGVDPDQLLAAEKSWPYFTAMFDTFDEAAEAVQAYKDYKTLFKENARV